MKKGREAQDGGREKIKNNNKIRAERSNGRHEEKKVRSVERVK